MNLETTVIDNIRKIRKEKGISQEKLAEYCDTSASYIGLMETYKNIPKLSTIERIAEALNVPPRMLFDEDNPISNYDLEKQKEIIKERLKKEIIKNLENCIDEALKLM